MKISENKEKDVESAISFYSKLSRSEKKLFEECANSILPEKKILTINDLIQFEKVKELLIPIKEKYGISIESLFEFLKNQFFIPVAVFNKKLTVLESAVKYLKEEKNLSLNKISKVIGRDERNIWHTYNASKKKLPNKFSIKENENLIPASVLSDNKLSAVEAVVIYLHDNLSLKFSKIAELLNRDQRTIWTSYSRARKKYAKQK